MLIDWFTVVAQLINFLVLIWLLKRFLYGPILNAIDARETRIAEQLTRAQEKEAQALTERNKFQKKNDDFDQAYAARMSQVAKEAKTEQERLLECARQEFNDLRHNLQLSLKNEQQTLKDILSERAQEEVFSIARKALADLADASLESQMVDVFIERLQALSDEEKAQMKSVLQGSDEPVQVRSAFVLSAPLRESVEQVLKSILNHSVNIEFTTQPNVISGIEVNVSGQKVSWSIDDYLASLAESIHQVLNTLDKGQAHNETQSMDSPHLKQDI